MVFWGLGGGALLSRTSSSFLALPGYTGILLYESGNVFLLSGCFKSALVTCFRLVFRFAALACLCEVCFAVKARALRERLTTFEVLFLFLFELFV